MKEHVLLIGNGPSAAKGSHGKLIDQFEGKVVRFNKCVLNDDVGHRTDIWVTWGENSVWRELGQSQTLLTTSETPGHKEAADFANKFHQKPGYARVTDLTDHGVRRYIHHPSAGALATAHFLRDPDVASVSIFGFDHFAARQHHYWTKNRDDHQGHDPYRESHWFGNLIKQGRISRWNPPIPGGQIIGECGTREELVTNLRGVGVELGVASGWFSERILALSKLETLYSIDRWGGDRKHDISEYRNAAEKLNFFGERSVVLRALFAEAVGSFPDAHFDFIYIDGYAHTGQEAGATLEQWWPKLKVGGVFAGHDYSQKEWPKTFTAVNDFIERHGLQLGGVTGADRYPSWYLIKAEN